MIKSLLYHNMELVVSLVNILKKVPDYSSMLLQVVTRQLSSMTVVYTLGISMNTLSGEYTYMLD